MESKFNFEYELYTEYKSKAETLACKLEEKRKEQHKLEFYTKGRYHAVYLNEKKLKEAEEKAKAQGITIQQYYKEKYS